MSKTKEEVMASLWDCCRANRADWAKEVLNKYPDKIDFFDTNYKVFDIAVVCNSMKALQALLDFYTETKLQHPKNSMQYKTAFVDLQNLLYDAQDGCWPSDRIREILKPYLTEVIDTTSERDEIMEEDRVWPEHEEATTEERNSGDSVRNDEIETMPLTMINLYLKDHSDEFPKAETIDSKLIGDTL